jgi:hypothetical protein
VEDGLRDKLFFRRIPPGTDLFSLNIQRGRDQGVPGDINYRLPIKVCYRICTIIHIRIEIIHGSHAVL